MPNKWLNLGSRGQQKEGANGGGGIGAAHLSPGMAGDTTGAPPRGDLLLLEDIYRTAGIMEPRMGYSITKVVEKLSNDHLRGLGDEVKRASVLMALNAAGGSARGYFAGRVARRKILRCRPRWNG